MSYRNRILLLTIVDVAIIAAAVISAYLLRFDFEIGPRTFKYFTLIPYVIIAHILFNLITLHSHKIYRRVWQYASIGELVAVIRSTTIAEVVFVIFHQLVLLKYPALVVPRSIYPLSWAFIIIGIGGSRFFWRIFRDTYTGRSHRAGRRRTIIFGAGNAGVMIAKELKSSPDSDLFPVAFVDDDPAKWRMEILGLPVLGGRDKIPEIVRNYGIQKIIIAVPSMSKSETAKIIEICKETGAKVRILPRMADLVSRQVSISMIRDVSVEDLLGRDPVRVDLKEIAEYIAGQVVLVTGAGGSIGSELCRQVSGFSPRKMILLGHGENSIYDIEQELLRSFPGLFVESVIADIQDLRRLREVFEVHRPTLVFHAAAHKHVPLMERNPAEAVKNNILGTRNVAECAHEFGADRFVMISTDKAVNPTSVMGTTKRVAEMFIQGLARESHTKFAAVRFGNVLGSRGSVVPLFKRQIAEGGPVTVTHPEMVRYFMTIPEAVQLVIQAGAYALGGEIFILDMGKPVRISDLARDLIRLSGLEPGKDIEIKYTGVRPGEKLYEEILTREEGISATKHDRIFIGKPGDFSWNELLFMIKKLEQAVTRRNPYGPGEIKELLRQMVPEYRVEAVYRRAEVEEPRLNGTELAQMELEFAVIEAATSK